MKGASLFWRTADRAATLGQTILAHPKLCRAADDYECVYCVVDWHALTTLPITEHLREWTAEWSWDWLAAAWTGARDDRFCQSHVRRDATAPGAFDGHAIRQAGRFAHVQEKVRQQPIM